MQVDCCPHCGHPIRDEAADALELMREWCREHSVTIDYEGAIASPDADRLLGLTNGALRNQRCLGVGPQFIRRGGRCRYRLEDLAAFFSRETQ